MQVSIANDAASVMARATYRLSVEHGHELAQLLVDGSGPEEGEKILSSGRVQDA
jgi:hypothetical protein